jgi:thiol-disulfide isomerase/thioredoxin
MMRIRRDKASIEWRKLDMRQIPRSWKTIFLMALGVAVAAGSLLAGWSAGRGTLVVFDANWCASCRELVPVIKDVAGQNSLSVSEIDVDAQDAPKQAHSYGLTIPNDEPPQVYFVSRGRATQIYNGKGYKFGYSDAARATILQNLQRVLP